MNDQIALLREVISVSRSIEKGLKETIEQQDNELASLRARLAEAEKLIKGLRFEADENAKACRQYEKDSARIDAIAVDYWKVDPFDIPTGAGDADVGWRVSHYQMGEPSEKVIVEHYADNLREAIDASLAASKGGEDGK